jgi:ATP-dependent Lon protease
MFPLPNVQLFPGCVMPLHVFEPRYRAMVEDLLDSAGRLVIATVPEEHVADLPASPPVYPVAGLGEIGRHERLPDGRFLIWVVGLARVRLCERPSEKVYRLVAVEPLEETRVEPRERADALRASLESAIRSRCNGTKELPSQAPIGWLADLLLQKLRLPCAAMQQLYAETDVERRARGALSEHARRANP